VGHQSRPFFRELESGDDALLGEGLANLDTLLDEIDLDGGRGDRSYSLPLLEGEDVEVTSPDRPLTDCIGLSLAARSRWSVSDHASYQSLSDLTGASPDTTSFLRSFTGERDCFADRSCTVLRTVNSVVRENRLATITFEAHKDYHWVYSEAVGWAMIARGWTPEPSHGTEGENHIWQHFEIDVFIPDGQTTRRYFGVWTEPDYDAIDAETAGNFLLGNIDDTIRHVDEWLDGD
jgi:hypothetical protein